MKISPSRQVKGEIEIIPVSGFRGIGKFIDIPWRLYADDPLWVPPLRLERRLHLSRFNPYFRHAQWQGWIACRDNQPIGRISAQIDELHQQRYGTDTGHFGMLESIRDEAVFSRLIQVAESWLVERGVRHQRAVQFFYQSGMWLTGSGFDSPPVFHDALFTGVVYQPAGTKWLSALQGFTGLLAGNGF
ncbi:MAG: hypothetical protein P0107_03405 [Nitrosomonas sp.]|nr:hypothetical protein [Nitrosomonas sp.]